MLKVSSWEAYFVVIFVHDNEAVHFYQERGKHNTSDRGFFASPYLRMEFQDAYQKRIARKYPVGLCIESAIS